MVIPIILSTTVLSENVCVSVAIVLKMYRSPSMVK